MSILLHNVAIGKTNQNCIGTQTNPEEMSSLTERKKSLLTYLKRGNCACFPFKKEVDHSEI